MKAPTSRVQILGPHQDGVVVSVSASHAVGWGFACRPGYTKDHHKNASHNVPLYLACGCHGRSSAVRPDYVCSTWLVIAIMKQSIVHWTMWWENTCNHITVSQPSGHLTLEQRWNVVEIRSWRCSKLNFDVVPMCSARREGFVHRILTEGSRNQCCQLSRIIRETPEILDKRVRPTRLPNYFKDLPKNSPFLFVFVKI